MFLFFLVRDGTEGIAIADADGGNVQQVTSSPTFDHQGDWGLAPTP